jgi:hypothetical protein
VQPSITLNKKKKRAEKEGEEEQKKKGEEERKKDSKKHRKMKQRDRARAKRRGKGKRREVLSLQVVVRPARSISLLSPLADCYSLRIPTVPSPLPFSFPLVSTALARSVSPTAALL